MPRYIDADALLEKAWDADTRIGYVQVVDVGDVIDAPTISPDEVRGAGKWIDKPYFTECSVCHAEFDSEVTCSEIYGWPWVHCPKCGARLLGDENDS